MRLIPQLAHDQPIHAGVQCTQNSIVYIELITQYEP